ncbi:DMT family transporter [Candidatus Stoquefichus massiliensis]|uniref:DMT family transporter n=1 Tax=Candidatus Stoquefichus massiliensis TaxID=1470350 RepID=UPI0004B57AAE|nr:DMT family transporter [Candidatus Stoquefichus massiliensis]
MNIKQKGIVFTVISTIIFGITPAIGKFTYSMGNNGIQLAFLRHLFVVPLFLFIVLYQKLSLKVTKQQFKDILKVGFFGNTLTVVLLYSSYSYIGVGSATVLHFLYPLFVCIMNFILYQQKLNHKQILCLVLAMVGILCFIEKSASSMFGFLLAVGSGIFFAYYMIGMDHSTIRYISPYVFNFYLVIMNSTVILLLALITKSLSIMPLSGYLLSMVVAVFTSLIGVVLFQKGICCLGASLTAILSTLEPITSIIVGILFLNEQLTLMKIVGCLLVLLSTFILVKNQAQGEKV